MSAEQARAELARWQNAACDKDAEIDRLRAALERICHRWKHPHAREEGETDLDAVTAERDELYVIASDALAHKSGGQAAEIRRLRAALQSLLREMALDYSSLPDYDVYQVTKGEVQRARAALAHEPGGKP
jgi:hypothetical protein